MCKKIERKLLELSLRGRSGRGLIEYIESRRIAHNR